MNQTKHETEAGVARGARDGHAFADYAYDALYVGFIGGGLVALFFLVYDLISRGMPFYTPSLLGSVLFGAEPAGAETVNMMAVALYSLVHFFAFGLLGIFLSLLTHQLEIRGRHPVLLIGLVFLLLQIGFWLAASVALPGVVERIGQAPIAAANLIAAIGVATFLAVTHRPRLWQREKPVTAA